MNHACFLEIVYSSDEENITSIPHLNATFNIIRIHWGRLSAPAKAKGKGKSGDIQETVKGLIRRSFTFTSWYKDVPYQCGRTTCKCAWIVKSSAIPTRQFATFAICFCFYKGQRTAVCMSRYTTPL